MRPQTHLQPNLTSSKYCLVTIQSKHACPNCGKHEWQPYGAMYVEATSSYEFHPTLVLEPFLANVGRTIVPAVDVEPGTEPSPSLDECLSCGIAILVP